MENNQNEINLKHEKLKLHYRYIIVICFIICIGTIIIAAHSQEAFVSQVSFAGTITSIVLSVIAIWMSISGERTTNDIRIKITESTERLSDTTKNVETLNKNYEKTMDTQLNELKNVQEQLAKVIFSINNVGEQVSHLQEKNTIIPGSINNNIYNTTQRTGLFIENEQEKPSRTYRIDWDEGRIIGFVDGQEAMNQYIKKAILTPRFRCLIYSNQYGSEIIETLMDKEVTREYIEAEISFLVTDTLIHDPRVLRVYNVEIEFKDTYPMQDSCVITFDVDTIYGEIPVKEVI